MKTLAGKKQLSIPFSRAGRVFFIFSQKMYGYNPTEMEIKVLITAPTQKNIKTNKIFKDFAFLESFSGIHQIK